MLNSFKKPHSSEDRVGCLRPSVFRVWSSVRVSAVVRKILDGTFWCLECLCLHAVCLLCLALRAPPLPVFGVLWGGSGRGAGHWGAGLRPPMENADAMGAAGIGPPAPGSQVGAAERLQHSVVSGPRRTDFSYRQLQAWSGGGQERHDLPQVWPFLVGLRVLQCLYNTAMAASQEAWAAARMPEVARSEKLQLTSRCRTVLPPTLWTDLLPAHRAVQATFILSVCLKGSKAVFSHGV